MTSCSGLLPVLVLLPLGNYICVCHLPSGHSGEYWDKSFIQVLAMSASSVNMCHGEAPLISLMTAGLWGENIS